MSNYGLTADKVSIQNFFRVAVDNKCYLKEAKVGTAGNSKVIDLVWVSEDGSSEQQQRLFEVNASNLSPRPGQTFEEMEANLYKTFNTKLKHIATKFNLTDEDFAKINTSSFETYATDYCKMLNAAVAANNPLLYIKVYKDNKGYSKVSEHPPFLQRVDEGDCKLDWTTNEIASNTIAPTNGVPSENITSI